MGNTGSNCCDVTAHVPEKEVNVIVNQATEDGKFYLGAETQVHARPLIMDLEHLFREHCDSSGSIGVAQLGSIWRYYAHERYGQLSSSDEKLIAKSIRVYSEKMQIINPKSGGEIVKLDEFMTFMLGGTKDKIAFGNLNVKLREAVGRDPTALSKVYQAFHNVNKSENGHITLEEVAESAMKMHGLDKESGI